MADDVVGEGDVEDAGPGGAAILVAHGEEDGGAVLIGGPVILEEIAVDEDALGVLELEAVLDGPAGVAPGGRLEEVVTADFDVGGDEVRDERIGPAEHEVLGRAFEVVVDDLVGAGAVPAVEGLRVEADALPAGDVGIDDGGLAGVQGDAALAAGGGVAVDVAAVDHEVVGQLREARLVAGAEADEAGVEAAGGGGELDADEAIVVGARVGLHGGGGAVAADDGGHLGGVGGGDARAFGELTGTGGADEDPAAAVLGAQGDGAIGRAGLEDDLVAGLGAVDGALEAAAGGDGDGLPGHGGQGGVDGDAGAFGERGRADRRGDGKGEERERESAREDAHERRAASRSQDEPP